MDSDEDDFCHPATLMALRLSDNFDKLRIAIRQGFASPYSLCKDDVHIPPSNIRGRIEPPPNYNQAGLFNSSRVEHPRNGVFTAHLNTQTGKIRVDHTGIESFWLEIDVKELADVWLNAKYHPDNSFAKELAAKHTVHACMHGCPIQYTIHTHTGSLSLSLSGG